MIRKVLTIGKSSLAVTLPRSFLAQEQVQAGDEIHVEHLADRIVVKKTTSEIYFTKSSLKEINSLEHPEEFTKQLLEVLFLYGSQQALLTDLTPKLKKQIRDVIDTQQRFYVDESKKENELLVMCAVGVPLQSTYSLTKRILQRLYQLLEDILQDDRADLYEHIQQTTQQIAQRIDLARRATNQNLKSRQQLALYALLSQLRHVNTQLRHTKNHLEEICAESRELLKQIKKTIFLLTQAFSNQHLRANVKLFNQLQQLTKNCREAYCEHESITERSEERVERLLEALTDAHTYLLMYHAPQEQTP